MTRATASVHVRWPAESFYWGVLDASVLDRITLIDPRRRDRHLGYLFESSLPLPIEEVHAVYRRVSGDRFIACGVERELLSSLEPTAAMLGPASLPAAIAGEIEPDAFNLITGAWAPPIVRRLRRLSVIIIVVAMGAGAMLGVLGLERRTRAIRDEVAWLAAEETRIYERALGPPSPGAVLPPERLLVAELARLERTRRPDAPATAATGVAPILAGLLSHWPAGIQAETSVLSVGSEAVTITAEVPTMADAQALSDALADLDGWTVQLPRTQARSGSVDVTIRLVPKRGAAARREP
jgi:hypothetical protein